MKALNEIEKKKQLKAFGTSQPSEHRLDPEDQIPLNQLRGLDKPSVKNALSGNISDEPNKFEPFAENDREVRRNHYPVGVIKEKTGKEIVQKKVLSQSSSQKNIPQTQ